MSMQPKEIALVGNKKISCEGNGKAKGLGHPRIFLNMGEKLEIDCPYCGKHFEFSEKIQSTNKDKH